MEREFKVGDRVVYKKGELDEDFGVITHFDEDVAYVNWESDGKNLFVRLSEIKHSEPEVNFQEALIAYVNDHTSIVLHSSDILDAFDSIKQWYADSKKTNIELEAAKAMCEANGFELVKR